MRHMRPAGSPVRGLGLTACLAALALATAPAAAAWEERPPPPLVPVADDALADALESGELTEAEYALERARSVFSPASAEVRRRGPAGGSRRDADPPRPGRASRPALGRRRARGERPPRAPHRRDRPNRARLLGAFRVHVQRRHVLPLGRDDRRCCDSRMVGHGTGDLGSVSGLRRSTLEYRPPRFDGATDQTDGPGVDKRKARRLRPRSGRMGCSATAPHSPGA